VLVPKTLVAVLWITVYELKPIFDFIESIAP
jgi:hypothetical protein